MSNRTDECLKKLEQAASALRYCDGYADRMYWLDVMKTNSAELKKIFNA